MSYNNHNFYANVRPTQQYIFVHDDDVGYVIGRNKSKLKYIQQLLSPYCSIHFYDDKLQQNTKIFSIRGPSNYVDIAVIYFLRIKEKLYEKQRTQKQTNYGYGYGHQSQENFDQTKYEDLEPNPPWLNEVENDINYQHTVSTIHNIKENQIESIQTTDAKNWDDNTGYNTLYNDYYFDYSNF